MKLDAKGRFVIHGETLDGAAFGAGKQGGTDRYRADFIVVDREAMECSRAARGA